MIDKNRYDYFGNKIEKVKLNSIKKQKDLDLNLYIDLAKTLLDYRTEMIACKGITLKKIKQMRLKHREILKKIGIRLKIPTFDIILTKYKTYNF